MQLILAECSEKEGAPGPKALAPQIAGIERKEAPGW